MSSQLIECKALALKLTPAEKAELATNLIASLDSRTDEQNEQLWVNEANRRYSEYKSGKVSARPAEDVMRSARIAVQ
jgi:putative addiction module component (TIGR02574 family)